MKERLRKWAPWIAYPLFYMVCLAVFAAATFPYDRLKERVVATFNAQQRASGGGQQELQIDDMGGYWLSGARVKGVRLLTAPTEPGKPPQKIEIDEATVRYGLLPLVIGRQSMHFHVYAFGGEAEGDYQVQGKDKNIEVTLDDIDVGRVDPLVQALGVPVQGKLTGSVRITMPEGKAGKGSGAVSFEAKDVSVGDGKAKIKGTLALPKLDVGSMAFAAEAKDGVFKITKLVAGGKDIELQGEGRITMRELATDSICDAQVRFRINDGYRNKNDMTKSLFGAPGSNAPALFELADPRIKQSKRPDGFYAWNLRGPLGRLDFQPAAAAAGGSPMPMVPFGAPRVGGP